MRVAAFIAASNASLIGMTAGPFNVGFAVHTIRQRQGEETRSGFLPLAVHRTRFGRPGDQAAKYSTPASKIGWYLLPGTLTYSPLPERSE